MNKSATITIRVKPNIKKQAEDIYDYWGLTLTEAINIFLHKSINEGGIPFSLNNARYNEETELAMKEARAITNGELKAKSYSSVDSLMKDLASGK